MTFPGMARFLPIALLLLRITVAVVFITSGRTDLAKPAERAASIGMSKGLTIFIGAAEVAGGLGVLFGVLPQLAAAGLTLIMLGAIYKKIAVWHTGFWGVKSYGWHYDLMLLVMCLVILATNGGPYVITK
jgi:putative oxidoreductase